MPFGKIYSEWNIAKEGGQDLFVGFYRLLERKQNKNIVRKEKTLHVNTQFYYLKTLRYCLNRAVSEDYITVNPMNKIKNEDKPKRNRTERDYLTIKELTRLVHTPFYNTLLRKAFLFSCFCGLRHCDIIALRWEDIRYDENGNALLSIIQKKTKEAISLPLCSEAIKHLPDRGNAPETEKVFADWSHWEK